MVLVRVAEYRSNDEFFRVRDASAIGELCLFRFDSTVIAWRPVRKPVRGSNPTANRGV